MKTWVVRMVLGLGWFFVAAGQTGGPGGGSTFPGGTQRTLQFENEDVAVWRTVVPPNAPLVMHTHQHPRVIIPLAGGTMKVVYEEGGSEVHTWDTGKAYWLPRAEGLKRHADQNTGSQAIEVMVVELKKAE